MSNQTNEEPEKSHVDRIKNLVVGTAKAPASVAGSAVGMAGSAVGMAKDAASAGLAAGGHVLKAVTGTALGAVAPGARQDTGNDAQPSPTDVEPQTPADKAPSAPSAARKSEPEDKTTKSGAANSDSGDSVADELEINPDEPVNVTEELGLDPSPIAKPKRKKAPAKKPATKIDAAADTSQVSATPADVAKVADKDLSASEQDVEQPDGENV
ncbi:hypothetical protein BJ980_000148 [Nocardioides daedukensis]|uniref:Uncharacterized protein n=1 Tax=Nocardioides daedukensis TaxID=634462 RepID=A0A7Y9UVH5_9ACTN|nr:hypothetical protein [Nocardioides daedukensis]NYG57225.1 hypothetical protein [Nocardioides daedukensis]